MATGDFAPRIEIPETFNMATYFIDRHVEEGRGDNVAVYYKDRKITYRELQEMVNRTGNALLGLGVEMENRVLLILLDCPEFVASYFGAIKIGAVPVPVNTMLRSSDYHYFLKDSRSKVLIISEEMLPEIEPIKDKVKYLKSIVVVGEGGGYYSYNDITLRASPSLEAESTSKDDACFWLYSSGSTGAPKGVVHLQHDMVYSAECTARYFQITEKDICLSASKAFFAYGLLNSVIFPFNFGASAVFIPEPPTPEAMFEAIERYKPTIFFGVPVVFNKMLALANAGRKHDLSSLRMCVSAGEALPAAIYRDWKEKFGIDILDSLGSTEVGSEYIVNRVGDIRPGSSGKPVPGYEVKIVDENGDEVERGEPGVLMVKGDSIAAYYWNKHARTKQCMRGEFFYSGDIYVEDEDGYYWYQGRADDMLKSGGIWVSPVEVENVLMEHEAVAEAAVVGFKDENELERPRAFIVLRRGCEPSPRLARQLQDFAASRLALFKVPRRVEFVEELPKTATGKIQRFRLRN